MPDKKIAFCPTMTPFAQKIGALEGIEMVPLQSAGQSMDALKRGRVDGALIGRYAKSYELDALTRREILKTGYTLVYHRKMGVDERALRDVTVNTYLPEENLQDFKPFFKEIRHYDSLDACLADHLQTPVLIAWQDFRDAFELLIPMNAHGKTPLFRAPVLYYKSIGPDLVEAIKHTI